MARRPWLLLALVAAAVLAPPAARAQDDVPPGCAGKTLRSRVFQVRFKPVPEAVLLIEQMLGPCGAYRVPKALRVVTVTDEARPIEQIAQALASWDVPPRPVEVTVSLILATRTPGPRSPLADEIRGVSQSLAQLTRFTHFERLGTATVRVLEGSLAEAEVGERYHVAFRVGAIDAEHGVVRLEPFELFQRPAPSETGSGTLQPRRLLEMTVNLPEGRMNLVGASGRGNERALFLALTAWTGDTPRPAPAAAVPGE